MLKKILSATAVIAGAALSTLGVVTLIKGDDTDDTTETTTTTTEVVESKDAEIEE